MAARLLKRQDERTRLAIKTRQLVNRLQRHALGELNGKDGHNSPMTADQIRAAEILLKKVLPDTKVTEVAGSVLHEHEHIHELRDAGLSATNRWLEGTLYEGEMATHEKPGQDRPLLPAQIHSKQT